MCFGLFGKFYMMYMWKNKYCIMVIYFVGYEIVVVYMELCEVYVLGMFLKCIFEKVIYNVKILFLFNVLVCWEKYM